jgi:Fe(II)/alpha-ketoglutarate-dependent arginine beta-hydroxylase
MYRVEINEQHQGTFEDLIDEIDRTYPSLESEDFLTEVTTYAQELPRDLRKAITHFRSAEPSGACLISGYHFDDGSVGPTPAHWTEAKNSGTTRRQEIFFFLIAALMGEPIAWASQQDGTVMNDVLPIAGREYTQAGSGSKKQLDWHTEDSFHPLRADYIGLMCIRNHDGIETTMACIDDAEIPEDCANILRDVRFPIRPDGSHLPDQRMSEQTDPHVERLMKQTYTWIDRLNKNPDKIAVLFGDSTTPYLRVDPFFLDIPESDKEARDALETLVAAINKSLTSYSLQPGEIVFLDNYKMVHGRKAFTPRFDGTDRWLKRLNVVRDLRKSRAARLTASSHTIF